MCKSLIILIILTFKCSQILAINEIQNLTEISNTDNDAEREVNTTHEMSTSEIVATSSIETQGLTTADVTTSYSPWDHNNNDNSNVEATAAAIPLPSTNNYSLPLSPYCTPSLCEVFNGTHIQTLPHIACQNHGNFAATCGAEPHLLYMSERRRNLILDLHNLARSRIAAGQIAGYEPATRMPQLKWDAELEYLATLHAKRCKFTHDMCRNTPRFRFSGQNIGYYWIRRDIKSHSRRIKNFIVSWFKEHFDANQTFIDSYHLHPDGIKIGHFTQLVSDRVHRVGCAAIRYHESDQPDVTKFLMTCNYDYTNIFGEAIYQTGPTASKCIYKRSDKFPSLCDWKKAVYEYEMNENEGDDDGNVLDNNISIG